MTIGVIGTKCGMSRVFNDNGTSVPVTVVSVEANFVTQIKTQEIDGYNSLQVSYGVGRTQRLNKAMGGHYAKAGVAFCKGLHEFRIDLSESEQFGLGREITVEIFKTGQQVDVRGTTIGRGFSGGVRRHGFEMQDATHGNSVSHRAIGSTGQCQFPGRVLKGKKMAGQHGNKNRTIQRLEVVRVDAERKLLLVKGSVPGAKGGRLVIQPSIKA